MDSSTDFALYLRERKAALNKTWQEIIDGMELAGALEPKTLSGWSKGRYTPPVYVQFMVRKLLDAYELVA